MRASFCNLVGGGWCGTNGLVFGRWGGLWGFLGFLPLYACGETPFGGLATLPFFFPFPISHVAVSHFCTSGLVQCWFRDNGGVGVEVLCDSVWWW